MHLNFQYLRTSPDGSAQYSVLISVQALYFFHNLPPPGHQIISSMSYTENKKSAIHICYRSYSTAIKWCGVHLARTFAERKSLSCGLPFIWLLPKISWALRNIKHRVAPCPFLLVRGLCIKFSLPQKSFLCPQQQQLGLSCALLHWTRSGN